MMRHVVRHALSSSVAVATLLSAVAPYAFSQANFLNTPGAVRLATIVSTAGRLVSPSMAATAPLGRQGAVVVDGSMASAHDWAGLAQLRLGLEIGESRLELETGIAATQRFGSALTAALRLTRPWFSVDITAALERAAEMESMLLQDSRDFVLAGTVHAPGTPHDTLTVQQAADRIARRSNRFAVHGVFTPVLQIASSESAIRWAARFGVPSVCCSWTSAAGSSRRVWAELNVQRAVSARVDVLADIGTRQRFAAQPSAVGLPFVRVGLTVHRNARDASLVTPAPASEDRTAIYSFSVIALDSVAVAADDSTIKDGRRVYLLRSWAPRANSVRVRGDFSEWRAVDLTRRAGGIWETRIVLAPGVHSLSIQVDGAQWTVPPGMASGVTDFDDTDSGIFLVGTTR